MLGPAVNTNERWVDDLMLCRGDERDDGKKASGGFAMSITKRSRKKRPSRVFTLIFRTRFQFPRTYVSYRIKQPRRLFDWCEMMNVLPLLDIIGKLGSMLPAFLYFGRGAFFVAIPIGNTFLHFCGNLMLCLEQVTR